VGVERPAATLSAWHGHLGAISREHLCRRVVVASKDCLLNATDEQPDTGALFSSSRYQLRQRTFLSGRQFGEESLPFTERLGEEPENPTGPNERLEPAPLIEAERCYQE
jgi:hypothetical protein